MARAKAKAENTAVGVADEIKEYNGPMIYVGPGFRDSRLATFAIFADGVPDEFKNTIYAKLFVKPAELNDARAQVGKTGTALNTFYMLAVQEHEKGGK
jgi:hypothetical protein